jgi:2-polyprenyl-3-methyl-5-hydroxy-6-metoxy-1,4-benzoquinol methylase
MSCILDRIQKISRRTTFDFREFANPEDELSHLFNQWVDYYRLKYAICKAINPKNILEIGVRYGYSAISFLKAAPRASYLGIDNDSANFGGSVGAYKWAKMILEKYDAEIILSDTQKMESLPGSGYDLIHIDGQQDGDGTFHDLEMALEKGRYVLVDGFFWTAENMISSAYFMKKYDKFFEYAIIIPNYAGDLLIKTKVTAKGIFSNKNKEYSLLQSYYNSNYYLTDCGGYEIFTKTNGMQLDERLKAVYTLANPSKTDTILDVGCGRGELAYALLLSGARVVALDYSSDAVSIGKKTFQSISGPNLEYIAADVVTYNTDKKFDIIIASDIVEHIEEKTLKELLMKISSLLKKDGKLIIHTAPNLLIYKYNYSKKRKLARQIGCYLPADPRSIYEELMHINEFSPARLNRLLKSIFTHTLTWAYQHPNLIGSLEGNFSKNEYAQANSIFAIASNREINREVVIASLCQYELNRDDISVEIELKEIIPAVKANKTVKIPLKIFNKGKSRIASLYPYPV